MTIGRRRFLRLGLGAAALAGLAGLAPAAHWWRTRPRGVLDAGDLRAHLHETFAYLHPEPEGVATFVARYLEHHNAQPTRGSLPHVEDTFLMSTDFFPRGQPPAGPIRFVALYHPYVTRCYNPFVVGA